MHITHAMLPAPAAARTKPLPHALSTPDLQHKQYNQDGAGDTHHSACRRIMWHPHEICCEILHYFKPPAAMPPMLLPLLLLPSASIPATCPHRRTGR